MLRYVTGSAGRLGRIARICFVSRFIILPSGYSYFATLELLLRCVTGTRTDWSANSVLITYLVLDRETPFRSKHA